MTAGSPIPKFARSITRLEITWPYRSTVNLHMRNYDSIESHGYVSIASRWRSIVSELQFANAHGRTGKVKVQWALRVSDSPVSRRTGERRTFWPCPKYCDWLTRGSWCTWPTTGDDVCSFSCTACDSCVYWWTSSSLSRSTIALPVAHGKVGTRWRVA